jgi:tetratricopeptide (TPR) repeat protein
VTRVDLHPDDLFDRARAGELTYDEAQRLRAHVAGCAACALELAWTADGLHTQAPSEGDFLRAQTVIACLCEAPDRLKSVAAPTRKSLGTSRLAPAAAVALLLSASAAAAAFGESGARWILDRVASRPGRDEVSTTTAARARVSKKTARLASVHLTPSLTPPEISLTSQLEPTLTPAPELAAASPESVTSSRPASRRGNAPDADANAALSLLTAAHKARALGQDDRALELYRALAKRYPESRATRASLVSLASLLMDRAHDPAQALQLYRRYLTSRDAGPLMEEARLGCAQALDRLGQRERALGAWRELLAKHPDSIHANLARERVAELGP